MQAALWGGAKLHPAGPDGKTFADKVFVENGLSIASKNMPGQDGGWAAETSEDQPELYEAINHANPLAGRVLLAGDWMSHMPGWQEGSLDTAHLATDLIWRATVEGR